MSSNPDADAEQGGIDAEPVVDTSKMADPELEAFESQPETTQRELWSWYMYDWANSVVFQTVTGSFLGPALILMAGNNEDADHKFAVLPGIRITSATYYSSITPIAVVLQVILFLLFGSLGDFGTMRKKLLMFTGLLGAAATTLLIAVTDSTYWLGGLLYIILQVCIGFSLIQYNSYMPGLVANLPEVKAKRGAPMYDEIEAIVSAKVSTRGFICGYVAGLLLLIINVGISFATSSSCSQWCRECPAALGNETTGVAGWNAYDYEIKNGTMAAEQLYCNPFRTCLAWPGINPPCGNGSETDIVLGQCVNLGSFQHTRYGVDGARWSLAFDAPFNATERAFETKDLCSADGGNSTASNIANVTGANPAAGLWAALAIDSGKAGCVHFRCAREFCKRNTDPTTCDPDHIGTRVNLMTAGLWWGGFGLLSYWGLKPRPGPPLPPGGVIKESLKRTWTTVKKVRKLRHTFIFLLAFFFYADGFNTIAFGAAIVATQNPLFLDTLGLGLLLLETNIAALLGNFFYAWLSATLVMRWRKKRILAGDKEEELDSFWVCKVIIGINIVVAALLPIWGTPGIGGLNTNLELYIAGGIYGFQAGSYQSFSRVLLAHLTPLGCDSEFFSMYELVDKGSSWVGPILLVAVYNATNNYRWGFFSVIVLMIIGGTILMFVDAKQGGLDAANFHISKEVAVDEILAHNPHARVLEEKPSLRHRGRAHSKLEAQDSAEIELVPESNNKNRPRNETECASTRQLPLPEPPRERETD